MRRTKLASAVTLALAGAAGAVINPAHALHVNPDGVGEVLIYPYYTARSGIDTLLTVVNTSTDVKAVKVRFLEGKNSREVLDFNLYLSPLDVWTGAISETADGLNAQLTTQDTSCTVPDFPDFPTGVPFRNFRYIESQADGESTDLNRTKEGYFEVIEMGVLTDENITDAAAFNPARFATHVNGVPRNCPALVSAWAPGGTWDINRFEEVIVGDRGGLFGNSILISVNAGTAVGSNALAIDDFSRFAEIGVPLHFPPGDENPTLGFGERTTSVFDQGGVVNSTWDDLDGAQFHEADPVSAVLMHNQVYNEYVTEVDINATTDWVLTFPTKRFHVGVDDPSNDDDGDPTTPPNSEDIFGPPFTDDFWVGGACEPVFLRVVSREEEQTVGDVDFSPQPPGQINALCWETNVITFNDPIVSPTPSDVLGSELALNINTLRPNGWATVGFSDPDQRMIDDDGVVYFGLPVIGFAIQNYQNNRLAVEGGDILSNYSALFEHAFDRFISSVP